MEISEQVVGVKNNQKLLHRNKCLVKSASHCKGSWVSERVYWEGPVLHAIKATSTLKLTEIIDAISMKYSG